MTFAQLVLSYKRNFAFCLLCMVYERIDWTNFLRFLLIFVFLLRYSTKVPLCIIFTGRTNVKGNTPWEQKDFCILLRSVGKKSSPKVEGIYTIKSKISFLVEWVRGRQIYYDIMSHQIEPACSIKRTWETETDARMGLFFFFLE